MPVTQGLSCNPCSLRVQSFDAFYAFRSRNSAWSLRDPGAYWCGWFGQQWGRYLWSRLTVHCTPKHGSWLNQAEIEISLFARQCLGKRRIPSLSLLRSEARVWNRKVNRDKVTIN